AGAARRLDVIPVLYAPATGPARDVTREATFAPWDDEAAIARFASGVDVVTYELEQLPLAVLDVAARETKVAPCRASLEATQDRLLERHLLQGLGIPVAPFVSVASIEDLDAAAALGFPLVMKRTQGGYDGKSQVRVRELRELESAFLSLGGPCIAERFLSLRREVSVLLARGRGGEVAIYDPVENLHRDGILRVSRANASLDDGERALLQGYAQRIAEKLDHIGLLTVELFETEEGFCVNELAPRVHNSGHWTLEGAETSQFENHVRAVCGFPLGSPASRGPCALVNVIGESPRALSGLLSVEGAALHLYGKSPAPGRKLGHVTVTAATSELLEARLCRVLASLAP
ncbi:MAG: 5-(carboxyamino)imidazole ribonucleotide synthase, partial [Myxococcota bacterium]